MTTGSVWIDARILSADAKFDADVCIVGAGPAGLTLARVLGGTGRRVVLLEGGGPQPRAADGGRVVGLDYFPLARARMCGIGGSSNHWDVRLPGNRLGARYAELSEVDFTVRKWLPYSGWPASVARLRPFYQRAADLCGIEPEEATEPEGALRLDPGVVRTETFRIGPADRWRPERLAGVTALSYATAVEVLAADTGARVRGVRVKTAPQREFTVAARVVVLAGGGIENARLLLLSGRGGLGNGRDLVGRFFMEHPWLCAGIFAGPAGYAESYGIRSTGPSAVESRLVLTEDVRRRERLYGCGVRLRPLPTDGPERALSQVRSPSGRAATAALVASALRRGTAPRDWWRLLRAVRDPPGPPPTLPTAAAMYALDVLSEQEPNPASRVLLDPVRRDAFGLPRPRLDWRLTERDVGTIVRTLEIIGAEVAAAGLGGFHVPLHARLPPVRIRGGRHHMGTTRMHEDPVRGVVDADCRVHGLSNLYVTGSSVFPTGGHVNPTLTVVALALRLGAQLAERP